MKRSGENRKLQTRRIGAGLLTLCLLLTMLPLSAITVFAATGKELASGSFATSEGMWNGEKTDNLIPDVTVPVTDAQGELGTGSGEDIERWQAHWNDVMVPAGWGSDHITGEDDALQIYSIAATDGSPTFAIRPAKTGTSGDNANLGGAGEGIEDNLGGVSYTVALSAADIALAQKNLLQAYSYAEFYRQKDEAYHHTLSVEFFDADGTQLAVRRHENTANTGAANGYMARTSDYYTVPAATKYIRFWYCNVGSGDARKSVRNMQAFLVKQLTVYPYASSMTQSSEGSVTLTVDQTGSSYQWQVSDAKDGEFADVSGQSSATYTFTPAHGKWYRCVIDGNRSTRPVQMLKTTDNDSFYRYNYDYVWYLSNDSLAYALYGHEFDIVGKYENLWIPTSYNCYWDIDANQNSEPAALERSFFSNTGVEKIKITFDPDDERKAAFTIDLRDGYQAVSVGTDTQLYLFDSCPLTAKEFKNGKLKQIQMVGANSLEAAKTTDPAFVITPVTDPSSYWIGYWSNREGYTYNDDASLLTSSNYTFDRTGTYVTQINKKDSGMTISWTNVPSGGAIQFAMSIGTVQQTGAILKDPVSGTDTMELVVSEGSYYRLVDPNGQPVTEWKQPDSEGKITFEELTPDTLYTIETVSLESYKGGNPDEEDIDWLDEVYTKIPIEDTTTNSQAVEVTAHCVSAEFGNLDFEKYKYYITVGNSTIPVSETGLATGLNTRTAYSLTAEDKSTYNTSTAANFTTTDHNYQIALKQDTTDTITAFCAGENCNDTGEITLIAPQMTTYGDGKSANATLSEAALAGITELPAIQYLGRAGTDYAQSTAAPVNAGKYTAQITVDGVTAKVDYEVAKATPTDIPWPTGLKGTAGNRLNTVMLPDGFTWITPNRVMDYGMRESGMRYQPDAKNYNPVEESVSIEVVDEVDPTGTISVGDRNWSSFIQKENIRFDVFFNEKQTVTVTADDGEYGSGVDYDEFGYYITDKEKSVNELANMTYDTWKDYTGAFDIEPNRKCIIYVRFQDYANNMTYLSSDGIVLDNIAPSISGIESGKTYCGAVEVSVSDAYLDKVTVGGVPATVTDGKVTVSPASGAQEIIAYDKAGNTATCTVTVNNGHSYTNDCDADCNVDGCTQGNREPIHTPKEDDGDCTTDILCSVCNTVTAKGSAAHSYTNACDADCNSAGCTAGNRETGHIPGAAATCLAAQTCTECAAQLDPKLSHSYTGEVKANADKTHAFKCVNGCDLYGGSVACFDKASDDDHICDTCGTEEITAHTPGADDGNCTTAILCTQCSAVTTAAKTDHSFNAKASASLASAADCQHRAKYYVQCDHCDAVSGTLTVAAGELGEHSWDAGWSSSENDHWHKCLTAGCSEVKDEAKHFSNKEENKATYTKKPICDECGREYGAKLVDSIAPAGEISIGDNGWLKFWNTVTFGVFCKDYVQIEITGTDAQTGVKAIEYYLSDTAIDEEGIKGITAWTAYTGKIRMDAERKLYVYAKITDNAGNVRYLSANGGIVVFRDTEITTGEYEYTLTTKADIVTNIKPGNNTVNMTDICEPGGNAGDELDYFINSDGYIVLKGESLEGFTKDWYAGDYTVTVMYNALGETYVDGTSKGDKITDTVLTLTVKRFKVEKPAADSTAFTYTGGEQTYHIPESEYYTVTGNKRTNAGEQEVTVALKDTNTFEWADGTTDNLTFSFNIGKATPNIGDVAVGSPEHIYLNTELESIVLDRADEAVAGVLKLTAGQSLTVGTRDYNWTFTPNDTGNYNNAAGKVSVTVEKIKLDVSGMSWDVGGSPFTYDKAEKSVTLIGTLPAGVVAEKSGDTATNAGSYTATATFSLAEGYSDGNYEIVGAADNKVSANWSVAPKSVTPAIEVTPNSYTYTGEPIIPDSVIVYDGDAVIPASEYTVAYTDNINAGAATVTVTDKAGGNYTVNGGENFNIGKADPTVTWPNALVGNAGDKLSTVTLESGFTWDNADAAIVYSDSNYAMTYTPADTDNYNILKKDIKVNGLDVTFPTGEITLKDNKWNAFLNNITFGLFFKQTQSVAITAADTESGVQEIAYYLATEELSIDDVKALESGKWTVYADAFDIEPDREYVVYAKITDNAGNVIYINSDGIVLDSIKPVIAGVEDGKDVYGDASFTVDETYLDTVTLDGAPIEVTDGKYSVPADNKEHTIVVTDKTGNQVTYKLTVYKNYKVSFMVDGKQISSSEVGYGKDAVLPELPAKDGYTAKWDAQGKNITADTVITAVYEKVPQTGDGANILLWTMLLLASGICALAVLLPRKREQKK